MKKSASTPTPSPAPSSLLPSPAPPAPPHPLYRLHWRTEVIWRAAHIEFIGHIDLHSLTPEAACETFADKFPDREIIRLSAL